MKKKLLCLMLVRILFMSLLPQPAAAQIDYAPNPAINYSYSTTVTPGTVRYICQLTASHLFYEDYWPAWRNDHFKSPDSECSTACISMALSCTGINVTPKEILEKHDGVTYFRDSWGGAEAFGYTDQSSPAIQGSHITEAAERYRNGGWTYSPPIIHLPGYSTRGHYVVIIGQVSPGVYMVLDPGNSARSTWTITIDGLSASYNHPKTGAAISDHIDGLFQYRNPGASPEQNYLTGCERYSAGLSLEFTKNATPYTLPCDADTAAENGCTSRALTGESFTRGSTCRATGLYRNSAGEYWYKVTLSDGSVGYVHSDGTTADFPNPLQIEGGSFPDSISGPTALQGTIHGGGAEIKYVRAYVFPSGSNEPVLQSELAAVNDSYYKLNKSVVDNSLAFGELEALGAAYYRLEIVADVQTYYIEDGQLQQRWLGGLIADRYSFYFGQDGDGGIDLGRPDEEEDEDDGEGGEAEEPGTGHSPIGQPGHNPVELPGGFCDVEEDAYYCQPVLWAVENGITNGTSEDTFSPDADCLRAQVVTFLWRAEGCPAPESRRNPFRDVEQDAYYYDAVLWALENGITTGVSANRFGPDEPCTREQVVTFLYRTMGEPRVRNVSCPFTDVEADAWYETPVLWAVKNGITNGVSADCFGVGEICTRAQIVTFLYRTYEE